LGTSESQELDRNEAVHIFCPGGIGCVKVSAYLKQRLGFTDVRRLQHGIIGYQQWLADHPEKSFMWEDANLLFEKRRVGRNRGRGVRGLGATAMVTRSRLVLILWLPIIVF
jgi:predicted sulfurtransferase